MRYRAAIVLALLLTGACSHYDVTVNERVVYTPRPLFSDFSAADPALQECLEQAVAREKITSAAQLKKLNCSDAGISDLAGLEVFAGLRWLKLSGNRVSDLAPLAPLSSLEALYLDGNRVVDPVALYELISLRILDLSGNPTLRCPRRQDLLRVVELSLPDHCPG